MVSMLPRAPLLLASALALAGCRGAAAERPMSGNLELCCKDAIDEVSFVGCRPAGPCRATESVWIRGPLICTADTLDACAGGRCCTLDIEPLARFATDSSLGSPLASPIERQPDPASITAVPLDWGPLPTPISVPRFVCPASGIVMMQVDVDAGGRVTAVTILEGFDPECDALAREALLHAEFEPAATPEGQPIQSSLRYEYEFAPAGEGP
jgi:TonB family protein